MILSVTSNKPGATAVTLVNGVTDTGYSLLAEAEWGNAVFDITYSGHRGTQGALAAGSKPQNRPVVLPFRVVGSTKDDLLSKISALATVGDELRRFGGKITVQSNNQTFRQHLIVMGGQASVTEWGNRAESKNRAIMVLEAACAPFVQHDPMEVTDDFSTDRLSEYTFDTGASTNVAVTGGVLDAAANLTTENRAVHSLYGYNYGDNQVTVKFTPGSTITSFKAGVVLKRTAATTFLEVYVDDNGTNSRLRYDKVIAGTRTNIQSTNLGARVSNGTAGWVRGRIEGNVVYAEYFTSAPTPMGTPTTSYSNTLVVGTETTTFGSAVTGKSGWSWIPQQTAASLDDFGIKPYVRRNLSLPQSWSLYGPIPGDAPALADVTVSASGILTSIIYFGLIGWTPRPTTPGAGTVSPFGILEAETATPTTWAVTADADYRGGSGLQVTTSGSDTARAEWLVDVGTLTGDDHTQGEISLEVWARVEIAATVTSPVLIGEFGDYTTRYTQEWGSVGRSLTLPSSGTRFRFVRVGTFTLPTSAADAGLQQLRLVAAWGAGSTGTFGLDYALVVPSASRALSPTSKVRNATYPWFIPFATLSSVERAKTVRSDLSGLIVSSATASHAAPTHGLGGSLIELPTGNVDMAVKISDLVPDDTTSDTTSETAAHSATVSVSPTPRSYFLRAS